MNEIKVFFNIEDDAKKFNLSSGGFCRKIVIEENEDTIKFRFDLDKKTLVGDPRTIIGWEKCIYKFESEISKIREENLKRRLNEQNNA